MKTVELDTRNEGTGGKPKAVIWYIATRPCLKENLESLYLNFNREYRYPVIVFTLGKQYDGRYKRSVLRDVDAGIKFVELPSPKIPSHIEESELFYNRTEIDYVQEYFPPSRIGYLHMIQFVAGYSMRHPELDRYDFGLKMDDDTFIVKKIDVDLFELMRRGEYKFAPFGTVNSDYPRARQTQIGLRELVHDYVRSNGIKPKSSALDELGNWNSFEPRDPTIWDLRIFRSERWSHWWRTIDESGGIYTHRWGDCEIHGLFVQMYYSDDEWHDFDFYNKGVCVHGGFGPVQQPIDLRRRLWNKLTSSS